MVRLLKTTRLGGRRRLSKTPYWVFLLLLLQLGNPRASEAASVEALPAAAKSGTYGLRVTVGSSCTSPHDVTVNGQILAGPDTREGCRTVSSSSTTVTSGTVTFRAGERIALGSGFAVQAGAGFVAEVDSSLIPDAYVEDETPSDQKHYAAGFFLNPANLTMAPGDQLELITGHSASGTEWFSLMLGRHPLISENRLVLEARRDDGTIATTEGSTEIFLPSGWHWIFVEWKPTTIGSYGYFRLYVDDYFQVGLGPLGNDTGRIDLVKLGAQGVDSGTSGSLDLDDFDSRLAGPIPSPP